MQNNTENQVYAGFFVRLAAYIIDWIIVGCVLLVVKLPAMDCDSSKSGQFYRERFYFFIFGQGYCTISARCVVFYPAHLFHRSNIGKTCNAFAGCQQ